MLHRVFRVLARPQAEAIVVLGGQDQPLHASLFGDSRPLVGIQLSRIEQLGRFVAVAPFAIGERVQRKVDKAVELQRVPRQVGFARHRTKRLGRRERLGGQCVAEKEQRDSSGKATHSHHGGTVRFEKGRKRKRTGASSLAAEGWFAQNQGRGQPAHRHQSTTQTRPR